jgi:fucose permease
VPNLVASIVFIIVLGFFLGPHFPAAIVVATKSLLTDLHISAIGFAAAFGGGCAAIFPFAADAIAERKGVAVLQPFVLDIHGFLLVLWLGLPGGLKKVDLEMARGEGPRK